MKKKYLVILISVAFLGGCGSSSNDSAEVTKPTYPDKPTTNPPVETVPKCDRGVLLNSILPAAATSIFDEPLFQLSRIYNDSEIKLFADEYKRDGQMLYRQYHPIFNTSVPELEDDLETYRDSYILNDLGLFTNEEYEKQNSGWPVGYIVVSQEQKLSTANYNDSCSFNASAIDYDFEKVDVSGKKIATIFPVGVGKWITLKNSNYTYLDPRVVNTLTSNTTGFTKLLDSSVVFPQGSFIYVPKSVIYKDTQFYFEDGNYARVHSLEQWIEEYKSKHEFKIDMVFGLNVAYTVDADGNQLYDGGSDPAIEKDGDIYDGEWKVKGNIISTSYGAQSEYIENYDAKGQYAYMNASSYEFIRQQIQLAYK